MAKKAKVTVHPSFEIGEISPRLFGAFLEPIGTMVNGVMYNPKQHSADEQGFRKDVISALNEAGLPAVRLPGGNYVSCWDWKDSIGPKEDRKVHLDLAWSQIITNEVGHDEYLQWAEKVGFEPLYTINLGTGDINEAMKIIEYTNHEGGTYYSELRKKYGHEKPYGVKVWYLGNEVDGPWQFGSFEKNPKDYGILVHEVSKAMKFVDGSIETVVCGSAVASLPHFPQWDLEVLEQCYETVDYVSIHPYHFAPFGDIGAWLGGSDMVEDYINTEIAVCDFVKSKVRSPKTMMLSIDEWASRPEQPKPYHYGRNGHLLIEDDYCERIHEKDRKFIYHDPDVWGNGMRMPASSEMLGTLANSSLLLLFIRHADRVKIGGMTFGIGALASTDRDHVWKTSAYYPYKQLIDYAKGTSIVPAVESETYDIPGYATSNFHEYSEHLGVKYIEAAAAYNKEAQELNIFVINRDWNDDCDFTLDIKGFEGFDFIEHVELYSEDLDARTTYENQNVIIPNVSPDTKFENGTISAEVKKLSWNMFRFKKV